MKKKSDSNVVTFPDQWPQPANFTKAAKRAWNDIIDNSPYALEPSDDALLRIACRLLADYRKYPLAHDSRDLRLLRLYLKDFGLDENLKPLKKKGKA